MGKKGLGRGLSALLSEATDDRVPQVRSIPLDQVAPNPYQPRTLFDPLKMQDLVASVKEHGILQPVLLKEIGHERFLIVAGERRFRAAQAAGLTAVPALIKECSDRELLEMAVVENVQREDIGVMEAARAYRRLTDEFGLTQEMVAQRVGKTRTAITNVLGLLSLPEEIQESVERGEISEGHARAIRSVRDDAARLQLWKRVIKGNLSVRATEEISRLARTAHASEEGNVSAAALPGKSSASATSKSVLGDPHEAHLANSLQEALQTKVILRHHADGSGRIEIEFYSSDELERLMDLLVNGRSRQ